MSKVKSTSSVMIIETCKWAKRENGERMKEVVWRKLS